MHYVLRRVDNNNWLVLDIDECERDTHECDGNATCTNTIGDYNCTCFDGFNGDGSQCQGKINVFSFK